MNANAAIQLSDNVSTILLAHTNFVTRTVDDNYDTFADQPEVQQFNLMNRWNYYSFAGYDSQFGIQIINEERRGGQITSADLGNPSGRNYEIDINTEYYALYAKNGIVFNDEPYTSMGLILDGLYQTQNSLFGLRGMNCSRNIFIQI